MTKSEFSRRAHFLQLGVFFRKILVLPSDFPIFFVKIFSAFNSVQGERNLQKESHRNKEKETRSLKSFILKARAFFSPFGFFLFFFPSELFCCCGLLCLLSCFLFCFCFCSSFVLFFLVYFVCDQGGP